MDLLGVDVTSQVTLQPRVIRAQPGRVRVPWGDPLFRLLLLLQGTVSRNRGQYEETPDRGLSTNLKGAPNSLEEGVFAKNKTRSIFQ